jgi:hypothetical protein
MPTEIPIVLSLVVCDQAYIDPSSDKLSLLGMISEIRSPHFPAFYPNLHVAMELTNGQGRIHLTATLVRTTAETIEGEERMRNAVIVDFPEPRAVVSLGVEFKPVIFPQAAEYRVIVLADGLHLAERRFVLVETDGG